MIARLARKERTITILNAVDDPHLFGQHFKHAQSWSAWRVFLAILFGLPLTDDQRRSFKECTGRSSPGGRQQRGPVGHHA